MPRSTPHRLDRHAAAGHPLRLAQVTGNYFRVLGIEAALGRTLEPSDTLITATVLIRSAQRFAHIDPGVRTRDIITLDVSPSYFDVFDLPILNGRTFTAEEASAGGAVAILSAAAAKQLWPEAALSDAPGRTVRIVPDRWTSPGARIARLSTVQVIGITRDYAADLAKRGPMPVIHFPTQMTTPASGLVVRVHGDTEAARQSLDAALAVVVPGAVQEIHELQEFVAGRLYPYRAAYWVSGLVGILRIWLGIRFRSAPNRLGAAAFGVKPQGYVL